MTVIINLTKFSQLPDKGLSKILKNCKLKKTQKYNLENHYSFFLKHPSPCKHILRPLFEHGVCKAFFCISLS